MVRLALVGLFVSVCTASLRAQDLNSELELRPITRWVLERGLSPEILECRLSKTAQLQCVSDQNLIRVECEGTQFGRRTSVKSLFKGRAFSCEGTRLDHESLMTQWKLVLKSSEGSESTWIVDAVDEAQLERLYRTEMTAAPLVEKASNPYGSLFIGGRQNRWGSDSQRLNGAEIRVGRSRWTVGVDFYQASRVSSAEEESPNAFRILGVVGLGDDRSGNGLFMGFNTGNDFLKGASSATSHCLGPEFHLNPGNWRFAVSAGNCWYSKSSVNFSPWSGLFVSRKLYGALGLDLGTRARFVSGTLDNQDVGGVDLQVQLGVSVSIAPH